MIILFEILFAIGVIHVFASLLIGLAQIFLGVAAQVAGWALFLLAVCVETFCRLWRTAFYDVES